MGDLLWKLKKCKKACAKMQQQKKAKRQQQKNVGTSVDVVVFGSRADGVRQWILWCQGMMDTLLWTVITF